MWDYPRPPRLAPDRRLVTVVVGDVEIARSRRAIRVLETASPPTFYLPPEDIVPGVLAPAPGRSSCEWKGGASYWTVSSGGQRLEAAAWSYEDPLPAFESLRGYVSFYPSRLRCVVDGVSVTPQPGGFYGGWVTPEVVGPFKGEPGTGAW